ncbi:hypothetical protein B0O99DRAFT_611808, partial [Bisporella sp. PMI_857]
MDIYNDLDHIPLLLQRSMRQSIRVMNGYCQVFGIIVNLLEEDRPPTWKFIDHEISYSMSSTLQDAKLFLNHGGSSQYALSYLINTLKQLAQTQNWRQNLAQGLKQMESCLNDTGFELIMEKL